MSLRSTGLGDDPVAAEAIAKYHDGLTDDIAAASMTLLERRLRDDGLYFGDRPLCSVLRPRFMTAAQYRHVSRASVLVASAMEKVRQAAMADASLREQFRLLDWEERLIHADPRLPSSSPLSRLDAFFAPGPDGLKYTEYNAETPAGGGYNDALAQMFLDLPAMGAFRSHFAALPVPSGPTVVHVLLETYYAWRGVRETPSVVILDWKEVPTYSEFVLFERLLRHVGVPVMIGDPRDAEYANGVLTIAGTPVTLIYKRVLIDELVLQCGEDSPVVRAVQDGAVCMVNPFRCKLLHKKASLAVVSDERQASLLSADGASGGGQSRAVDACRGGSSHGVRGPVGGTAAVHPGAARALRAQAQRRLRRQGYRAWLDGLRRCLGRGAANGTSTIPISCRSVWYYPRNRFPPGLMDACTSATAWWTRRPFWPSRPSWTGCLTRIATDPLLNVTAGGGSNVPTFLVEER